MPPGTPPPLSPRVSAEESPMDSEPGSPQVDGLAEAEFNPDLQTGTTLAQQLALDEDGF